MVSLPEPPMTVFAAAVPVIDANDSAEVLTFWKLATVVESPDV
jgi:hypothetical protein